MQLIPVWMAEQETLLYDRRGNRILQQARPTAFIEVPFDSPIEFPLGNTLVRMGEFLLPSFVETGRQRVG
jgi:hypothetical protein